MRFGSNFESVIFEYMFRINFISISCEIALRSQNTFNDKSTLIQIIARCRVREEAITWASIEPDLWSHMTSLGHKELRVKLYI